MIACLSGLLATSSMSAIGNLPQISMRNALFTWFASNLTEVTTSWNFTANYSGIGDGVHPAPPMQHAWADMLIYWWRAITVLHDTFDKSTTATRLLPKLPKVVQRIPHLTYACFSAKDGGGEMQVLNISTQDFGWTDYSHHGDRRFGYVGNQSGAWLTFIVNTTLHATAEEHASREPFVGVELVHTADTGATAGAAAVVTCLHGCECLPAETRVETRAEEHTLPQTTAVQVTQAPDCTMRITVDGPGRLIFTGITLGETYDGTTPVHSAPVAGFAHDTVHAKDAAG